MIITVAGLKIDDFYSGMEYQLTGKLFLQWITQSCTESDVLANSTCNFHGWDFLSQNRCLDIKKWKKRIPECNKNIIQMHSEYFSFWGYQNLFSFRGRTTSLLSKPLQLSRPNHIPVIKTASLSEAEPHSCYQNCFTFWGWTTSLLSKPLHFLRPNRIPVIKTSSFSKAKPHPCYQNLFIFKGWTTSLLSKPLQFLTPPPGCCPWTPLDGPYLRWTDSFYSVLTHIFESLWPNV